MIPAWSADDIVRAERILLDQGSDLMAIASWTLAARCAAEIQRVRGRVSGARAVLLVGSGNNGGDGLFAGALLRRRGVAVTAVLVSDRAHEAGLVALRSAGGRVVSIADGSPDAVAGARRLLAETDLALDAILGIGSRGAVRGAAAELLGGALDRPGCIVACDLPSGVDPDTGAVSGLVLAADVTVTFGAAKPGLLLPPGDALCGRIEVVQLGLDLGPGPPAASRWEAKDAANSWPWPWRAADKYARGVLGVVAGSPAYPGAGVLASSAAVATGSGMVRYAGHHDVAVEVVRAAPEVVPDPLPGTGRVQAWLVGSGLGAGDPDASALIDRVTQRLQADAQLPAVVDAGAITRVAMAAMRGEITHPARLVLTPHAGELATLLTALGAPAERQEVTAEPLRHAREAANRSGATVLLKGATTLVVAPEGPAVTVAGGPAWLATAGSGDVLAGVIGVLLAAGLDPATAAATAALVHGRAGAIAAGPGRGGPVRATAVIQALSAAVLGLDLSYEPGPL